MCRTAANMCHSCSCLWCCWFFNFVTFCGEDKSHNKATQTSSKPRGKQSVESAWSYFCYFCPSCVLSFFVLLMLWYGVVGWRTVSQRWLKISSVIDTGPWVWIYKWKMDVINKPVGSYLFIYFFYFNWMLNIRALCKRSTSHSVYKLFLKQQLVLQEKLSIW